MKSKRPCPHHMTPEQAEKLRQAVVAWWADPANKAYARQMRARRAKRKEAAR